MPRLRPACAHCLESGCSSIGAATAWRLVGGRAFELARGAARAGILVFLAWLGEAAAQPLLPAGQVPGIPTQARVSLATDQLPFEVGRGPRLGPYYLIRSEDTLASLAHPAGARDIFDRWKSIPFAREPRVFLTLSFEQRARYEGFSTTQLGLVRQGRQNLASFREDLGADLHLGSHLRLFGSLQSGQIGGEGYSKAAPANRDDLALLQAFAELYGTRGAFTAGVRAGRQQMFLGNGLLFALRDNTNIQQSYDGVRAYVDTQAARIDAFYLENVVNRLGVLNDSANAHQLYWGAYGSMALPGLNGMFIDPFYIGTYSRRASFDRVSGSEARSTFGARLWKATGPVDADVTGILQDGTQAGRSVSAFAAFSSAGYSFSNVPLQPRLGIHIDAATGGKQAGGTLHTYDPIHFPGIYISELPLLSPSNLVKVGVGLSASPLANVRVQVIGASFWRYAQNDFIYNVVGLPYPRTDTARGMYVGFQPALRAAWAVDRHVTVVGQIASLEISRALRTIGAKSERYVSLYLLFRL